MKRRTVLSILLALVLVCMGILSSCGSQGGTPVGTSQTEASGKPDGTSGTSGTTNPENRVKRPAQKKERPV